MAAPEALPISIRAFSLQPMDGPEDRNTARAVDYCLRIRNGGLA